MGDIVSFISTRLDDDEAYALEAAKEFGPDWIEIWSGEIDLSANLPDRQPPAGSHWDAHVQTNDSRVSRHMVRHDPARVLAEVKAKRRVLERHRRPRSPAEVPDNAFSGCCVGCGFLGDTGVPPRTPDVDDCPELRDLAAPFDQHPDYNPAWRVE